MRRKPPRLYYGWVVMGAAWLTYFLTTTPPAYGSSAVLTHLVMNGDIPEAVIGWTASARYCACAAASLLTGWLIQRFGYRTTYLVGIGMIGGGSLLCAVLPASAGFYTSMFAVMGFGMILAGLVTTPSQVTVWFARNRALPMAIVSTAGAVGGILTPILSERLVTIWGWRSCWTAYVLMAAIAAAGVLLLMREQPEDVSEVIDGRAWTAAHPEGNTTAGSASRAADEPLSHYQKFAFVMMCLIYVGNKGIFSGFTSYLTIYAVNCGMPLAEAAALLSVFNLSGLAGRFGAGALDHVPLPGHLTNALLHLLMTVGAGMMVLPARPLLWGGTFLFGFFFGASYTLLPLLVSPYFGDARFTHFYGIFNAVGYFGSTLTPIAVLSISHWTGGYQMSYLFLAGMTVLTMVLSAVCPIPAPQNSVH